MEDVDVPYAPVRAAARETKVTRDLKAIPKLAVEGSRRQENLSVLMGLVEFCALLYRRDGPKNEEIKLDIPLFYVLNPLLWTEHSGEAVREYSSRRAEPMTV